MREEEIFFVQHNPGMTDEELADKLDRTVKAVQRVRRDTNDSLTVEALEESIEEAVAEDESPKTIETMPQMAKTEYLGKNGGWAVMTPSISGRADSPTVGDGGGTGPAQKYTTRPGTAGVRPAKRS